MKSITFTLIFLLLFSPVLAKQAVKNEITVIVNSEKQAIARQNFKTWNKTSKQQKKQNARYFFTGVIVGGFVVSLGYGVALIFVLKEKKK